MARTAKQTIGISDKGILKNGDAGAPEGGVVSHKFANGVGADQIDRLWSAETLKGTQITLVAATPQDIDLENFAGLDIGGGAGNDELGQAMVLADVVYLRVTNRGGNSMMVGGKAVSGWSGADTPFVDITDRVRIQPGGSLILIAPGDGAGNAYIVAAALGDLQLESTLGTTCDVVIAGRSA